MIELRGITWNHTRGYTPLVACAQRFGELHPGVTVSWSRRSLLEFGEMPLDELARRFDLLVIDHPFTGWAACRGIFRPLDQLVDAAILEDCRSATVGGAGESYQYAGRRWAAPIDAACPVAVWRPDLLAAADAAVPPDWPGLLRLAARGLVLIPGVHTDAIHHFYMLLLALGAEPGGAGEDRIAPPTATSIALEAMAELYALVPEVCHRMNPIAVHEALAAADATAAYCPFAFGYANYCRRGYAARRLLAGSPPGWRTQPMRTTLGGTGLAISTHCAQAEWAGRFTGFVAAGKNQAGIYWQAGGQPAQRTAWLDAANDADAGGCLTATLPALDAAWVRPRFPGYLHFQDHAAPVVHAAACRTLSATAAAGRLDALWREARAIRRAHEN